MKLFSKRTGSAKTTYVPASNNATKKRYINTLDISSNLTQECIQIIMLLCAMPDIRAELKELSFGNSKDAYAFISFIESALNILMLQIEETIQQEYRCRGEILVQEKLYHNLISIELKDDQKEALLAFEQIIKDKYLAEATSTNQKKIIKGLKASKNILKGENKLHEPKKKKENNAVELAEMKIQNFEARAKSNVKSHSYRKIKEHPQLTQTFVKKQKKSIKAIQKKENIPGQFAFWNTTKTETANNND